MRDRQQSEVEEMETAQDLGVDDVAPAASPVAGVSAGKLNQYGLTTPEWHALVEIGVKLHNALMNEPEGEDWYDGQSLSIMTHLMDAFKAARLAQPSAAGDGKPPAAKYELCDTVFPDGQKCVRPKNHNFSKCSPKTKFMEYCAISQNDEANVRAEENKAKRKAAAALPAPPVLPEGDSTLAQPEEPITCPHGVVEGTHCSKCAEIDDARIERECQLASGGAMPTPARVDDAQTISIPVADIAFASEEYRQALFDKGQVMVAPLPARVEQPASEDICHRSTCGHPLSMHDDNGQCSAPSDSDGHDYGGEIGVQPLPCICPEFLAAPTPPATGEAANRSWPAIKEKWDAYDSAHPATPAPVGDVEQAELPLEPMPYRPAVHESEGYSPSNRSYKWKWSYADEVQEYATEVEDQLRAERAAHKATTEQRDQARSERDLLEQNSGAWTGKKCSLCEGSGEDTEARPCKQCSGTGDEYKSWKSRAESAEAENQELRRRNERLTDLVRHQRHELLTEKLIDQREYAALAADSENGQRVARLEGYDELRRKVEEAVGLINAWWTHPSAHSNPVGPMLREAIALLTPKGGQ